jgi:hypothetical protein
VRCPIYQDSFNKSGDKSLPAHFLIRNDGGKLTPKMSELEVINAIGGHYPNYIQRALLSAHVKTIQEAFSFLNKLQIMEDGKTRNSSSREPSMSRPENSSSAVKTEVGDQTEISTP